MFEMIKKDALLKVSLSTKRKWGASIILSSSFDKDYCYYREKFLIFNPRSAIPLESHKHHHEVLIGDSNFVVILEHNNGFIKYQIDKFSRFCIPKDTKHKIINPGESRLNIFEIQTGVIKDDDKIQFLAEDKDIEHGK